MIDDVTKRASQWRSSGDTGISSEAIWSVMMGVDPNPCWGSSHPHDPDDLGRCLRLLEAVPEWKPRIGEMATISKCWERLCARWGELRDSMDNEVGIDWSKGKSAPKTFDLMQSIINEKDGGSR